MLLHEHPISNIRCFYFHRYPIGNKELPYFSEWVQNILDVDLRTKIESQSIPKNFPEPVVSLEFLEAIQGLKIEYSTKGVDRLIRAHGHTLREIFTLKHGMLKRIPDIVLWPSEFDRNCYPHLYSVGLFEGHFSYFRCNSRGKSVSTVHATSDSRYLVT